MLCNYRTFLPSRPVSLNMRIYCLQKFPSLMMLRLYQQYHNLMFLLLLNYCLIHCIYLLIPTALSSHHIPLRLVHITMTLLTHVLSIPRLTHLQYNPFEKAYSVHILNLS